MKWLKYYSVFFICEQTSAIINRGSDPYEYKVNNNHWMARRKVGGSKWFELSGKDYQVKFQTAIDTLDRENPNLRTSDAPMRKETSKDITQVRRDDSKKGKSVNVPIKLGGSTNSDISDKLLVDEFNFHLIPDGNNNYRSAQIPIKFWGKEVLSEVIDKYNIKVVIRFNGSGKDGRNRKNHPITSVDEERRLVESKGIKFYKLSSTRNQDKVNDLLSKGNVLIHCAHGADRTGGNVGGYLYKIGWGTTDKIWDYSTKFSSWNYLVKHRPNDFVNHGYLDQVKKFGVRDLQHAIKLSK